MRKGRLGFGMLLWLTAVSLAAPASADLLATAVWPQVLTGDDEVLFALPLTEDNKTSVVFKTTVSNETVRITYSAQCGIVGVPEFNFNALVMVDRQLADPAVTDFALCTGANASTYVIFGAMRQVVCVVPTIGRHRVQVFGALVPPSTFDGYASYSIGNSSLVVDK